MPKIAQGFIFLAVIALIAGVAVTASAFETPRETPVKAPTSACDPAPALCGVTQDWSVGIAYAVALERSQLEAFFTTVEASGVSSGEAGGRYPRGCVGGESACIPTTPGTCVLPAYICARESSAINKYNYQGSGASGKYQAMKSTWGGYAGYENAADAPEAIQDLWASELWNNGRGCSHWSAC
jgi:hypothetical protein